ncbi:MAG: hypothetical protein QOG72_808 [Sphingomonadales bacterium]|jgi:hypothetical protein|nr:hypothetical protein [Sphingomonadales bacterium]
MSFVMPKAARGFFRTITERTVSGSRYIMFDTYYVCLLLGLDARRLGPGDELEGDRFLDNYPEDYKAQADYIAGLLIDAELERNSIDLCNKASVEGQMVLLLDPSNPTGLSATGSERLNRYAVGGFARIEEEMIAPAKLEDLLVRYAAIWTGEHE